MKITMSRWKLLTGLEIVVFTYFENIYSTPDHVTSVRERILSVSVVLLCICAYLLVLIRLKYTRFSNALLEVRRVKIILNVFSMKFSLTNVTAKWCYSPHSHELPWNFHFAWFWEYFEGNFQFRIMRTKIWRL